VMMMEDAPYEGSGAEEDRHGRRKPAAGLVLARWYYILSTYIIRVRRG
jgi:hypothetical protein